MKLTNELSNLSYTNKDFNSIYVELLEYAKKLSYKWDPTSSDESDPGVVLLKLAALIGDKDSYNIDKNVLELMPSSVTQIPAARQIFDQCGYSMRYYRSAEGLINLTIKKDLGDDVEEDAEYNYTIPQFTMFTDSDSTIVYTSTEEKTIPVKTEVSIPVIEGIVTKYTINNDSLITIQNLDSNNRLYFTETNIAENGIFITNVDSNRPTRTNYEEWVRVDNLQVEPKGSRCYKLGLTLDSSTCFIEFPDDIEFLMGEGLNISYVLTSGSVGNVSSGKIREFYVETKFTRTTDIGLNPTPVDATTETISIRNTLPILNGQDPESIDDAYTNYKRVRDTFDTLVSLKDYSDYLVTSNTASNGFVCDRTNDIQHSYKVLTSSDNSTYLNSKVEQLPDGTYVKNGLEYVEHTEPAMSAFDLCVYALQYVGVPNSLSSFKGSFQIVDMKSEMESRNMIFAEDVKSLQHDYIGFEKNRILLLKNRYPITAHVVPKYPLSNTEKIQVMYNIETALCSTLNSTKMSFGEEPSAEVIQDAILNADERIKTLIDFASPKYETFAVFKNDNNEFDELRIDFDSLDGGYVPVKLNRSTYNDADYTIYKLDKQKFIEVEQGESFDSTTTYYKLDESRSDLWKDFQVEIFSKNVLAGVTPLYTDDNVYMISPNQNSVEEYKPVIKLSTNTNIILEKRNDGKLVSSPLRDNENILLSAPNFVEENNFSSYVKMLYYLPNCEKHKISKISADTKYQLTSSAEYGDDYIIFFWKASDSDDFYTYVKYDSSYDLDSSASKQSLAKYISPTGFSLPAKQDLTSTTESKINNDIVFTWFGNLEPGKGVTSSRTPTGQQFVPEKSYTETDFVKNCLKSDKNNQVLTGTKIMKTFNVNTIQINNKKNGSTYIYWILNNVTKGGTSTLFDKDTDKYELKSGEYFLYTNDEKTALFMLGEGTILERQGDWSADENWTVTAIDYEDLVTEGIHFLDNYWYRIPKSDSKKLLATEQKQILIGPGNSLILTATDNKELTEITLSSKEEISLKGYTIQYEDENSNISNIPSIQSSDEDDAWKAHSILNVNMSPDSPQKLVSNQSITIFTDESTSETIMVDDDIPDYILSNIDLNLVGGTSINTEELSDVVSLLVYTLNTSNIEDASSSSSVVLECKKDEVLSYTFMLLKGNYLMKVSPDVPLESLTIEGENVTRISNTTTYKINLTSDRLVQLSVKCDPLDKNVDSVKLTLSSLFKYTTETLEEFTLHDSFETSVLTKIQTLDDKDEFEYTYRPTTPIINPLISSEFLKKDHFYNSYTICEWDAKIENNVVVHDVIR